MLTVKPEGEGEGVKEKVWTLPDMKAPAFHTSTSGTFFFKYAIFYTMNVKFR